MKRMKRYHWLADVINEHKYESGAEIGVATGHTSEYLMYNCPSLRQLIIVDDWRPIPNSPQWNRPDMKKLFLNRMRGFEHRLVIREGLSWEQAIWVPDNSLDFIFVDASHDYNSVANDLRAWIPKVTPRGIICGHDLHFKGVELALDKYLPMYTRTEIDNTWFVYYHEYALHCNY